MAIGTTAVIIIAVNGSQKASTSQENVVFDHYVTDLFQSQVKGHGKHMKIVVFDTDHWYQESAYKEDTSIGYAYVNGDDYLGICSRVGEHHNCNVRSGGGFNYFSVPKVPEKADLVDCPFIKDPVFGGSKRQLDKCYFTQKALDNHGSYVEWWIEPKTNFPEKSVLKNVKVDDGGKVIQEENTITDYCTFYTNVPSDKAKLGPIPGVKVYDFRNGKEGLFKQTQKSLSEKLQYQSMKAKVMKDIHSGKKVELPIVNQEPFHFMGPSVGPAPVHRLNARDEIPESFDAREQWPQCSVIKKVTKQSPCGSCWAMALATALGDRVCIATNGTVDVPLSSQYLLNCFGNQGGCQGGGSEEPMWRDMMEVGVVPESCVSWKASDNQCTGTCDDMTPIPKPTKAKNSYSPWGATDKERVEAIQREIMEHGPVTASFHVFSDFDVLSWSVYHRTSSSTYRGGHSVRIIGWGTENGEDYWLAINSWGPTWNGDGSFKIRRGTNECNIEELVTAGEPLI